VVHGVVGHQFRASEEFSYRILSDSMNIYCFADKCVLDLDPGSDEWSPEMVGRGGEYSMQYVVGHSCEYEVADGPFI